MTAFFGAWIAALNGAPIAPAPSINRISVQSVNAPNAEATVLVRLFIKMESGAKSFFRYLQMSKHLFQSGVDACFSYIVHDEHISDC